MIANCRSSTFRMTWADLDAIGENGGVAGGAGGQAPGEIRIVEPDANDKRKETTSLGVTASPEACTWPVATACRMLSTLPL